ncbi:molecular chaperone HtpG [Blattabacterium cuenoti]|uniref:molecular chaperone HtpG n=1 Tax=Blattabacterium cuenoti TaxID=1653831 RepID=UPI00163CD332|nr:molecular chaperone HtpG [Blattabacterium cuenoti]
MNKISVNTENIFPIIKKFLYSNQEVFLRELISNATDAILKLKTISRLNNLENINNNFKINILLDKKNKSIHIIDNGIGMNKKEIEKYINQIAFSGAEEFIQKYKNDSSSIIGHFGLGFYSSFMVSDKVIILTQSYQKDNPSMLWSCSGTTDFFMKEIEKKDIGTEIILFIRNENKEFLEYDYILKLLQKYCKFMPIPIFFSSKENNKNEKINNTFPAWKKNPNDLNEKDYLNFHKELYPNQLDNPLFWVHLNIDHPFRLNGILFFPKIEKRIDLQREKIHLYQNQVYITDDLQGIVPEFLSLLIGVIDSPDIPLNVSRSHLQSDISVKNISKYITRKVSDKLNFLFKDNREKFQNKWNDIKIIVEYGMISDQRFFERSINFFLFMTVDDDFFTLEEFKKKIKENQLNEEGKIVFLYSSDKEKQFSSIKESKNRNYNVLLLNSPLSVHLIQKLEQFYKEIIFVRVDSDHIDKLIVKKIELPDNINLSEDEKINIKNFFSNKSIGNHEFSVKLESLSKEDRPFIIVIPEYLRRINEMNSLGYDLKNPNENNKHQLIININHPLIKRILQIKSKEKREDIINNVLNLTLISNNLLRGKDLDFFISKNFKKLSFGIDLE